MRDKRDKADKGGQGVSCMTPTCHLLKIRIKRLSVNRYLSCLGLNHQTSPWQFLSFANQDLAKFEVLLEFRKILIPLAPQI